MIGPRVAAPERELRVLIPPGSVRARASANGGGRPPALDQEKADALVRYVRLGEYLEIAAAAAGIHDDTFRNWKRRAAEELEEGNPEGPFARLFGSLKEAAALAQTDALATIRSGPPNWQAQAWFKERTSARWRRRVAIAELEDEPEADAGGIEVRVHVVDSRPATPVLDVTGSSRITEEQLGGISANGNGNGNGAAPHA